MGARGIALIALTLIAPLVGCGDSRVQPAVTSGRSELPSNGWKPGAGANDALLTGRVEQRDDGCVVLVTADGLQQEILWPAGWAVSEDDRQVLRDDGSVATALGDEISASGSSTAEPGCTGKGTISLTDDLR